MNDTQQQSDQFPPYVSFIKQNRSIEHATEIYNQRIADAKQIFEVFSDEFQNRSCPVCGSDENEKLDAFHNSYGVVKCSICSSTFVNPCPSLKALSCYYNECKSNALLGKLLRSRHMTGNIILSDRVEFLIQLIKKYLDHRPEIKILEVGCSSGAFLSELKDGLFAVGLLNKCTLAGIDIDQTAIEKNVDTQIDLHAISAEAYSESASEKYDLIMHFELIEHLEDPFRFMQSVRSLLAPGGLHHFHTPNAQGFDNQAMGYNDFRALAHGIFPPMHLQAFTPQNITHFALRSNFKVIQIDTPGNFDVDIVLNTLPVTNLDSAYRFIHRIPKEHLAVFQSWLKLLCASSHLRCTLSK